LTFWAKKNLSRISPAKRSRSGPNSEYVDRSRGDNVQEILGTIGTFWAKWGLGWVPQSSNSQRPIFTKYGYETHLSVPSM